MSINALTSALATSPIPAAGSTGVQREQAESTSGSAEAVSGSSVPRVVFNPRSHYNASAGVFVMEYRSASTGEVERQFPDEQQLRAYENAKKLEAARQEGGGSSAGGVPEPLADESELQGAANLSDLPAQTAAAKTYQPVRIEV